jgi:aminoglycoside phosphotransferase (APT) family kinase protein
MIEREFAVMPVLAESGLPVPKPTPSGDDSGVIGVQTYVMECVEGRILWDPSLRDLTADQRTKLYASVNEVIAKLHQIDPAAVGLRQYGKPEGFLERQVKRWTQQYRASETTHIDAMESLIGGCCAIYRKTRRKYRSSTANSVSTK